MEVEDVSFVKKWVDLLEKQKSVLKNNSRRTGERPKDRQSRDQLVQEFMVKRMMATMQKHQGQNQSQNVIHQSFVAPPYLPSVKPFHELKQIYIKELKLETHHRGDFILLKVLTPPSVMTAVMAIVEDEFGQGVMLQLYQQEIWTDQVVEEIVHVGGVCILKEPYFKVMNDGRMCSFLYITPSPGPRLGAIWLAASRRYC